MEGHPYADQLFVPLSSSTHPVLRMSLYGIIKDRRIAVLSMAGDGVLKDAHVEYATAWC